MEDIITIPTPVYRAFKPLIVAHGKADPSKRCSEFVRLGVTAYDFTLTYSDTFILIKAQWPKPKDMGNAREGWYTYLEKYEYEDLLGNAKAGFRVPIVGIGVCPFHHDLLSEQTIQNLIELHPKKGSRKGLAPSSIRSVNPYHMERVTKALLQMCKNGGPDGFNAPYTIDLGTSEVGPILMTAFTKRHTLTVTALVMPVRR